MDAIAKPLPTDALTKKIQEAQTMPETESLDRISHLL
jgi:hypothetical protein